MMNMNKGWGRRFDRGSMKQYLNNGGVSWTEFAQGGRRWGHRRACGPTPGCRGQDAATIRLELLSPAAESDACELRAGGGPILRWRRTLGCGGAGGCDTQ